MERRIQGALVHREDVAGQLLVTAGKMNKHVAAELELSEITVKIYRGAAMRKMKAKTLPDLVRMAEVIRLHGAGQES